MSFLISVSTYRHLAHQHLWSPTQTIHFQQWVRQLKEGVGQDSLDLPSPEIRLRFVWGTGAPAVLPATHVLDIEILSFDPADGYLEVNSLQLMNQGSVSPDDWLTMHVLDIKILSYVSVDADWRCVLITTRQPSAESREILQEFPPSHCFLDTAVRAS